MLRGSLEPAMAIMQLDFGVFDHLDRRDEPLGELYEGRLRLIEAYDRAGFHAYHLAEHHATPLGMAPSPGIFLSAVAQRTKRLRFGPLVYTLPLHNPLRLIEEICMLDQMSGGRFEIGVGKGISPFEVGYFGVKHEEAQAMYVEALDVILAGLTGKALTHHGKYYRFENVPIELWPVQKPHPPLWYGVVVPSSAVWLAQHAVNVIALADNKEVRAITDRYRAEWTARPDAATKPHPKMGVGRHVVVAETEREAHALAEPAYNAWYKSMNHLWNVHGTTVRAAYAPDYETVRKMDTTIVGTPEQVRAEVARHIEESGANYFIGRFCFGSLGHEQAMRSIDLFAREVMPHFRPAAGRAALAGAR
jgi:alkanesulfonate monooxygenase SsuD/methylene tetrahydromethanopterin reductase-like flavin-dependent oxidoreductase (luciferase family)